MDAVRVKHADRMMTVATAEDRGIRLTFADGRSGQIPFDDLPEIKDRSDLRAIELPNPYQMILRTVQGQTIEIPWDFARSYCDASYQSRVEAIAGRGRQLIGSRIRELRRAIGMTQDELSSRAGLGRVTLVRIENGDQSPRYGTLVALSQALDQPLNHLLIPDITPGEGTH